MAASNSTPQESTVTIDADDDFQDDGLGTDAGSATTSLKSSVLNFVMENGRRYHSYRKGHYNFPNDEEELDRMDLEHEIFRTLLGRNTLTPLKEPSKILDLGTGTGIWAIEIADEFPSAHVMGNDLSPVQPQIVPPNCEFIVDDFEEEWADGEDVFDLVHGRLLLASVTDYSRLFSQAFRAIKPGGYFEIHDIDCGSYCDDGSMKPDSMAVRWGELFREACEKAGRPLLPLEQYKPLLEEAGFVNVKEKLLKRPHNQWPKDPVLKTIGAYTLLNHLNGIQAFTKGLFTRALDWSNEEVEALCAECRSEWSNRKLHGYQRVIAIYGQKPGAHDG